LAAQWEYEAARVHYEKVIELTLRAAKLDPNYNPVFREDLEGYAPMSGPQLLHAGTGPSYQRQIAGVHVQLCELAQQRNEPDEARQQCDKALMICCQLAEEDPDEPHTLSLCAGAHAAAVQLDLDAGDVSAAQQHAQAALTARLAMHEADPRSIGCLCATANSRLLLARAQRAAGLTDEPAALTREALNIYRQVASRPQPPVGHLHAYARLLLNAEPVELQDSQASLAPARRAVEMVQGRNPIYLATLAEAQQRNGMAGGAAESLRAALSLLPPAAIDLRGRWEKTLAFYESEQNPQSTSALTATSP